MQKLMVGVTTLVAIVVGFVLFTSFDSPAQENPAGADSTITTIGGDGAPLRDRFGFGFHGDLPAGMDGFLTCLEEQGIEVPEEPERGFFFDLHSDDGLAEVLEACGFPGFRFGGGPLGRFEGEFRHGFGFHGLPEDFLEDLPEGFPFGDRFHGRHGIDRDALADCLLDSGALNSVDEARARLDECLPGPAGGGFSDGHPHHFGFRFDSGSAGEQDAAPTSA